MKILAKRGSDVFCPNQAFISDSESYMLLHKELDHSGVRGEHHLIPKIRDFECLEPSIQSWENELQIYE